MKKVYFVNKKSVKDFQYIFLCGTRYSTKKSDKRNVLMDALSKLDPMNRPIILERHFDVQKSSRRVTYEEAGFPNLYQVEMLVNELSDAIFVFLESISTGAESGMFIGVPQSQDKICLIVPDEIAVEENKLGSFLDLSIRKSAVKVLKFYPRIEHNKVSNNVSSWHSFFPNDSIGNNLLDEIKRFLKSSQEKSKLEVGRISFSKNQKKLEEGYIYYKLNAKGELQFRLVPRTLILLVGALLSDEEIVQKVFKSEDNSGRTIDEMEKVLSEELNEVLFNSVAEIDSEVVGAKNYSSFVKTNIKEMSLKKCIGMALYLFNAAGMIELKKANDYDRTKKVEVVRCNPSDIADLNGARSYFDRYKTLIREVPQNRIGRG